MRAIEGKGRLRVAKPRLLAVLSSGLIVLSLLGTGVTSAAVPNLIVSGTTANVANDQTSTTVPGMVSTSDTLRFTTSIFNADTSNVAQLFFTALVNGSPANVSLVTVTAGTNTATCTYASTLACSFGQLRAQTGLTIQVILTTPSIATGAPTSCLVGGEGYNSSSRLVDFHGTAACITGRWALNGSTLSDGGTSHGDFLNWFDGAALNGDHLNFHGRYVTSGFQTVGDDQGLGSGNKQTTQVVSPELGIGVTVADGTPASDWCSVCTSESSEVHVNNGVTYPAGFRIDIQVLKGVLKGSITTVYHQLDNGTVVPITASCPKTGTPSPSQLPCFTAKSIGSGNTLITIYTAVNGKYGM
jgi:hypothetical protein